MDYLSAVLISASRTVDGITVSSTGRCRPKLDLTLFTMSLQTVLRQYVDSVKRDYDYVLLDCRPSLGMLVINALSASDYVLVPVQADYLAAEGMTELVGTVRNIQRQINPRRGFPEQSQSPHGGA